MNSETIHHIAALYNSLLDARKSHNGLAHTDYKHLLNYAEMHITSAIVSGPKLREMLAELNYYVNPQNTHQITYTVIEQKLDVAISLLHAQYTNWRITEFSLNAQSMPGSVLMDAFAALRRSGCESPQAKRYMDHICRSAGITKEGELL